MLKPVQSPSRYMNVMYISSVSLFISISRRRFAILEKEKKTMKTFRFDYNVSQCAPFVFSLFFH